jgi:hypothetical protein
MLERFSVFNQNYQTPPQGRMSNPYNVHHQMLDYSSGPEGAQADNRANGRQMIEGDQVAQGGCPDEVDDDQENLQAYRDWCSATVLRNGRKMRS